MNGKVVLGNSSDLKSHAAGGIWGPVVKIHQVLARCNLCAELRSWPGVTICAELQIQLMVYGNKRRAWKVGSEG